jgi:uncharacterized membrane protein
MAGMPLHPAVVHVPIGLALLAPVLSVLALLGTLRGRSERRLWSVVALVQVIVLVGALVAQRTGHADEERVEDVVSEAVIKVHEEQAEVFTWVAAAGLATTSAVLVVPAGGAATAAALVATMASGAVAGTALWVGHSGGALVYQQGAASAYVNAARPGLRGERGEDDDD